MIAFNTTTTYDKLEAHLQAHEYKRGKYKGDAPADNTRRSRNWYRVVRVDDETLAVLFHRTHIITARKNGTVVLNSDGYTRQPTTRDAFKRVGVSIYSKWCNGMRNDVVCLYDSATGRYMKNHVFYDGMEFDALGNLVGEAKPLVAYKADTAARKQFMKDAEPLRAVFPILAATSEQRTSGDSSWDARRQRAWVRAQTLDIIERQSEDEYIKLVDAWMASTHYYEEEKTPKTAWQRIYQHCTKHMRVVVTQELSVWQ